MEKQHKLDELEQIIEKEQKERGDMISAHQHEIDDIRRNSYRQAEEALNEKHRQAILVWPCATYVCVHKAEILLPG